MLKLPKLTKEEKDPYENVAAQVLDIVDHNLPNLPKRVKTQLMTELTVYIEGYGQVVHKHAYRLGQDSADPELEPEEEG